MDLENEINKNKALNEAFLKKSENEKNKFAQALLNGMGEQIKNEIDKPPKIIKKKNKFKTFIVSLFKKNITLDSGFF